MRWTKYGAMEEYLESQGYADMETLTCSVDKMENCLLEVTFTDALDSLVRFC